MSLYRFNNFNMSSCTEFPKGILGMLVYNYVKWHSYLPNRRLDKNDLLCSLKIKNQESKATGGGNG